MSLRIKGILHKSYGRSTLRYDAECWAIRVEDKKILKTTELRMLRMLCGKTLKDKISNNEKKSIDKFQRLRYLGHLERIEIEREPAKALGWYKKKVDQGKVGKRSGASYDCHRTTGDDCTSSLAMETF